LRNILFTNERWARVRMFWEICRAPFTTPVIGPSHHKPNSQATPNASHNHGKRRSRWRDIHLPRCVPQLLYKVKDFDANMRRLDGCRTIGYSQILVLRELMHKIQVKSELEKAPRISDRASLVGGSGMGGYVFISSI
jgi:hypothetical protein